MANLALEVFLQGLGDPLADRTFLAASPKSHLLDQAPGELDREDLFAFWHRQRARLPSSRLHVAGGLARRHAKPNGQTRDDPGRSLFSFQKLNGLVHAAIVFGCVCAAQYDTNILLDTSLSIPISSLALVR